MKNVLFMAVLPGLLLSACGNSDAPYVSSEDIEFATTNCEKNGGVKGLSSVIEPEYGGYKGYTPTGYYFHKGTAYCMNGAMFKYNLKTGASNADKR